MKYHFKIHKEGDGFWAECLELEGCLTQADTMEVLLQNMEEALALYIQEPESSRILAPLPDPTIIKRKNIIEVPLDPQVAFSFQLRRCRIMHNLTQRQAAKKMNFPNLFSYQRLEAKFCNPNLNMILKIREVFPEFSVDALLA